MNTCKCPKCGYEQPRVTGIDCQSITCPKCGTPLKGESTRKPQPTIIK